VDRRRLRVVLRLIDIFAGCGGMTSGFMEVRDRSAAMFDPVYAVERDADAAATYASNFGAHVECRPIEEVGSEEFPLGDVLIGGPPCQGFSTLNRNRDVDVRRRLWREYERALTATEAAYFVMENVPQLLTSPEYADFKKRAIADDWFITEDVLNAADYGVPQRRRRAIVLGSRLGKLALPVASHRAPSAPVRLEPAVPWLTVRDAIGHLSATPDGADWHRHRNPREISKIRYAHVPPGGNRFDMQRSLDDAGLGHLVPPCWRKKTHGTTDVFGRMRWDEPAPTIRTEFYKPEKGRYLHPEAHRSITILEGALLMGFSLERFTLPEDQSLTSVGRQIGNAVPPPLATHIGQVVADDAVAHGLLACTADRNAIAA
jgi:DNA (cytosine-5)-methyltransferase 1